MTEIKTLREQQTNGGESNHNNNDIHCEKRRENINNPNRQSNIAKCDLDKCRGCKTGCFCWSESVFFSSIMTKFMHACINRKRMKIQKE